MKSFWAIAVLFLAFLICFIGCSKEEPTEPEESKFYVVGEVTREPDYYYPDTFYCDEDVSVTNVEVVPSVKINDQELELDYYGYGIEFDGDFSLVPDTEYKLVVTAGSKTATATVKLPGDFSITSPNPSYTLPKGSSLNASWGSASNAEFYDVYLYIEYDYDDTLGNYRYFYYSNDTIITETSITYGYGLLFPNLSEIDSITWGYGHIYIYALDGPALVPGTAGNVTGDGIGFFWASQERDVYFDVGNGSKVSKEDAEKRRKETLKKIDKLWKQRINNLKESIINN